MKCSVLGKQVWLHMVYGIAGNNKEKFWEEFVNTLDDNVEHIILEDLNLIQEDIDVWYADANCTGSNKKASEKSIMFLTNTSFIDIFRQIHAESRKYSFFIRDTDKISFIYKSRIDLCFVTGKIRHAIYAIEYLEMTKFAPDHCFIKCIIKMRKKGLN